MPKTFAFEKKRDEMKLKGKIGYTSNYCLDHENDALNNLIKMNSIIVRKIAFYIIQKHSMQ